MLPKPSLVLQVRLVPEDYTEEAAAEIKRSYMFMAQSLVAPAAEEEVAEGNLMRMSIRLMRPYWDPRDAAAEELWRRSFMPWLANLTHNLSTAMRNFNRVLHPVGSGNVTYEWADLDFGPQGVFRLKMGDDNQLPSELPQIADRARALSAAGAFGDDVVLVRVPSQASVTAQREAYAAALADYERAKEAWEQARATAATAPVADGSDADFSRAAEDLVAAEVPAGATPDALAADAVEAHNAGAAAPDLGPAPVRPVFTMDYGVWGVERADGTVTELDSQLGA